MRAKAQRKAEVKTKIPQGLTSERAKESYGVNKLTYKKLYTEQMKSHIYCPLIYEYARKTYESLIEELSTILSTVTPIHEIDGEYYRGIPQFEKLSEESKRRFKIVQNKMLKWEAVASFQRKLRARNG